MHLSRRRFLGTTASLAATATVAAIGRHTEGGQSVTPDAPETFYKVFPIGVVEKKGKSAAIRVFDKYAPALEGLDGWSHVNVVYWFDKNDTPEKRATLRVHPRGNRTNPLTGVFACRSPMRPNLIALSVCKIAAVEGNVVRLEGIDAFDRTPVLDLKPFIPPDWPREGLRVPAWARGGPGKAAS